MTNGKIVEVPRKEASLEALLAASITDAEARRMGRSLENTTPTAAPTTSLEASSQENHSNLAEQLCAPLPPEAIDQHPTKAYLSTIKTIFMIERLNQVFGLDGWTYKSEIVENDPKNAMVVMKVTFIAGGIVREQFGGNDNPDRGDAYKGALTDALSKICGYLGIGMDVYKGHGPTKGNNGKRTPPPAKPAPPKTAPKPVAAPPPAKPWNTISEMVQEFGKVASLLPRETVLDILGEYGVQSIDGFRRGPTTKLSENAARALACYNKLLHIAAEFQRRQQDPTTFEHYEAEGAWQ